MAVPDKDNVTEADLFAALGLGGAPSAPQQSSGNTYENTSGGSTSTSSFSMSGADFGNDDLLDIFGSSSVSATSATQSRRPYNSTVAREREAQLKEKAIRSRQWKEELERKKRDEIKAAEDARREVRASSEVTAPEDTGTSQNLVGAVAAKPDQPLSENRSATEMRNLRDTPTPGGASHYAARYGRDGGVASNASATGARDTDARAFQSTYPARDMRQTQPLPGSQNDMQGGALGPQSSQQAARMPMSGQTQAASMMQSHNANSGSFAQQQQQPNDRSAHQKDQRAVRSEQRSDQRSFQQAQTQPFGSQASQQGFQQEAVRSRMPFQEVYQEGHPEASHQEMYPHASQEIAQIPQDQRQPAAWNAKQPEESHASAPRGKSRAKDDPLGIVLIVLAILCVLVAASLLTGLWDISNL